MSRRVYNIAHDNPNAIVQEMMVSFRVPPIGEYVEVEPVIPDNATPEMVQGIQKSFYYNLDVLVARTEGRLSFTPPNNEAKENLNLLEILQKQNEELKQKLEKLERGSVENTEPPKVKTVSSDKPRKRRVNNG